MLNKYINLYDHPIAQVIPRDRFTSIKELVEKTGLKDRVVRQQVSDLAKEFTVISISQSGGGIKLPKRFEDCKNADELRKEVELVEHGLHEMSSRSKELRKRMRKGVAYKKAAEKRLKEIEEKENG